MSYKTSLLVYVFLLFPLSSFGALLEMGPYSYGSPRIIQFGEGKVCRIGKYCSIAAGVTIFTGGDHRVDWVTTYPFSALWAEGRGIPGHPKSKGDVLIGNDVWIGTDATILSGVKVGDGAVIGAKSVVAKDVPSYAIVVGNPAKVVKYRFEDYQIEALLRIKWWDWPDQKVKEAIPLLLSDDIDFFIEYAE